MAIGDGSEDWRRGQRQERVARTKGVLGVETRDEQMVEVWVCKMRVREQVRVGGRNANFPTLCIRR